MNEAQCETQIRPSYSPFQMGKPGHQPCKNAATHIVRREYDDPVVDTDRMLICDDCLEMFKGVNPTGFVITRVTFSPDPPETTNGET